ncbi:MAG TPA: exodeoxyribonuclease III [Acidimicrobiales bacterium]|nr:exodeoxyribonuclease III [Acidimicrobiales bacterium]
MRIATWNINSLKARQDRAEEWIAYAEPDVLCFQETKLADSAFPAMVFGAMGYESVHYGNGRWNGVAILSRVGIEDVMTGFADGADDRAPTEDGTEGEPECRIVSATCGGVRVMSVYVPNGRVVGSIHYEAKLAWLGRLRAHLDKTVDPSGLAVVCGDFNVAPEDRDVYDITKFSDDTHVTPAERAALREVQDFGLEDAFRRCYPDEGKLFSWWDYRAGNFHKGFGMRIDLELATKPLADKASFALIDRNARKGGMTDKPPSDHAPLFVDYDV